MICPTCGSHLNDDLKFCTQCGTPLTNAAPATPYAPVDDNPTELFTETPAYEPSVAQADVYQPNTAPVADVYQPGVAQAPYEAAPAYEPAPAYNATTAYDAPAQYGQDYATFNSAPVEPVEEKKGGKLGLIFGIISLVFGVISPICCCCGLVGAIFGIVLSLIAVVTGIVGIIKSKNGSKAGKIMAIIGLIFGALVLVASIGYLIFLLVAGAGAAMTMGGASMFDEFSYMF